MVKKKYPTKVQEQEDDIDVDDDDNDEVYVAVVLPMATTSSVDDSGKVNVDII